jgi:hypothetical protein
VLAEKLLPFLQGVDGFHDIPREKIEAECSSEISVRNSKS